LNKWKDFDDEIKFDTIEYNEAKKNISIDPMNVQYCYDLIKAGNNIFKDTLSKCSSHHKKMMEYKSVIENAYKENKNSSKLQEGLNNYNYNKEHGIKHMENLNAMIRNNNELMDIIQAEMIHTSHRNEYKGHTSEYKGHTSEYKGHTSDYKGHTSDYKGHTSEYKDIQPLYTNEYENVILNMYASNSNSELNSDLCRINDIVVKPQQTDNNKRVEQMKTIQKEALSTFTKKNHDYGDSFATYGPVGVIVRIGDKIQRLQSVTRKGISMVNDESIRDTLMDLHNYCAMAVMLMDEDKNTNKSNANISNVNISNTEQYKYTDLTLSDVTLLDELSMFTDTSQMRF
jgi:hypothetical protein